MTLFEKIIEVYPELTNDDFRLDGCIILRNDGDDFGDYIAKWEYSQPIPEGLSLGKP
jgi:XkdW protein